MKRPAAIVWSVWALGSVATFTFALIFGRNVPWFDDWGLVGPVAGELSRWDWVMAQVNEHWMPMPRAILLALALISDFDMRSGILFSALVASVTAAMLIAIVSRHRGRVIIADALFPLVLLNLGHWWNLLMFTQVFFYVLIALKCAVLLFIATEGWRSRHGVVIGGLLLILLTVNGAGGLILVPFFGLFMLSVAIVRWRESEKNQRMNALLLFGSLAITIMMVIHAIGRHTPTPQHPINLNVAEILNGAMEYCTMWLGTLAQDLHPYAGIAVGLLIVTTVALLVMAVVKKTEKRVMAFGFLLFLLAVLAEAVAIGVGRSFENPMAGFETRYVTLLSPLPFVIALTWEAFGSQSAAKWMGLSLVAIVLVTLPHSTGMAIAEGKVRREMLERFAHDLRSDMTAEEVSECYHRDAFPWRAEFLTIQVRWMREHHLGPLREGAGGGDDQ